MYYRVYAKFKDQSTFKAIDCDKGIQVNNLIFATIIESENIGKAIDTYKALHPNIVQIELRSVETNKKIKINY